MSRVRHLRLVEQKNIAASIVAVLDTTQDLLVESIADLARITGKSKPDLPEYTQAKSRISQARLVRGTAFDSAYEYLRCRVAPHQWKAVAALKAAETGLLMYSAAHRAQWPAHRIESEWHDYCLESKRMRMRMGEIIQRERAILYPLLAQPSNGRTPTSSNAPATFDGRRSAGRV